MSLASGRAPPGPAEHPECGVPAVIVSARVLNRVAQLQSGAIYSKRWAASVAHPVAVSLPLASKTPTEATAVNVWWSLPSVMFRVILFDPNQVPSGLNVK